MMMTFNQAIQIPSELRKRILADQFSKVATVTTVAKGAPEMTAFDGRTAAQAKVEEIAKASVASGGAPTIAKARADAWMSNPDLYAQDKAERSSPEFQANVAKIGKQAVPRGIADDSIAKLDGLAKARAAKDGTSFAKAYDAVLKTGEGAALYAKHRQQVQAQG